MAASDRCRSYFKRRKRTAEEELQGLTEQLTEQCVNLSAKIKKASHFQFHRNPELGKGSRVPRITNHGMIELNRKNFSPFNVLFYVKLERTSLYPGTKSRNELNRKKSPFNFSFMGTRTAQFIYPGTKSRNELNGKKSPFNFCFMGD